MTIETRQKWSAQITHWTEPVLLGLTVVFVVVALMAGDDAFTGGRHDALVAAEWLIWSVFPVEFAAMLLLAPARGAYLRQRWWELPIVAVTLPAIPGVVGAFARPLRFLRTARAARALRFARLGGLAARYTQGVRTVLTRHGLQYVLAGAVVLYAISVSLVYVLEKGSDHPIQSLPDAWWWGVAAVTSLPHQGGVPVTTAGKTIAVLVAFFGIALASVITANIAAFLVHSEGHEDSAQIRQMSEQLDRIEQQLAAIRGSDANASPQLPKRVSHRKPPLTDTSGQ